MDLGIHGAAADLVPPSSSLTRCRHAHPSSRHFRFVALLLFHLHVVMLFHLHTLTDTAPVQSASAAPLRYLGSVTALLVLAVQHGLAGRGVSLAAASRGSSQSTRVTGLPDIRGYPLGAYTGRNFYPQASCRVGIKRKHRYAIGG